MQLSEVPLQEPSGLPPPTVKEVAAAKSQPGFFRALLLSWRSSPGLRNVVFLGLSFCILFTAFQAVQVQQTGRVCRS